MTIVLYRAVMLVIAFCMDLLLGDPRWLYHPICLTGNLIGFLRDHLPPLFPDTESGKRKAGTLLVLMVCACSLGLPVLLLLMAYRIHFAMGFVLETFWCYQLLAAKSLKTESMKVYNELTKGDLEGARYAVSMIVGRDTQSLSAEGVTKATVETIAENASDGVVAPLFYMAIGGLPLMFLYKGINTMDSMIGYKDEKYLHLGRRAALLDDVANYIPARISGVLMCIAAAFTDLNARGAWKIFRRDRRNHASPNSAQTESAAAGALGVQLAGDAWYFGRKYTKPTIGDAIRPIEAEDIPRTNRLMYATSVLTLVLVEALMMVLHFIYYPL